MISCASAVFVEEVIRWLTGARGTCIAVCFVWWLLRVEISHIAFGVVGKNCIVFAGVIGNLNSRRCGQKRMDQLLIIIAGQGFALYIDTDSLICSFAELMELFRFE